MPSPLGEERIFVAISLCSLCLCAKLKVFSVMRGNLYIVSAPSGSGKTTLLQHLLRTFKHLKFSVSYTTRRPRQGEQDGVDYFFTDRDSFSKMVQNGDFFEWAEFNGQLYGTARTFVEEKLENGSDVILD